MAMPCYYEGDFDYSDAVVRGASRVRQRLQNTGEDM